MIEKYHISSRILHALMAVFVIAALAIGIYMTEFLPKEAANRFEIYDLHKSIGVSVLLLVLVRFINRLYRKPPALPVTLPAYEKFLAHFIHYFLYFLMLAVPLSGYLMSNSYGFPVHLFSINMPNLIVANPQIGRFFSQAHEILAYSLLAAVALHVAGALKHSLFDKPENNVLKRMF